MLFIFSKEFPPSDEELEAYRNGEVSQKSFLRAIIVLEMLYHIKMFPK